MTELQIGELLLDLVSLSALSYLLAPEFQIPLTFLADFDVLFLHVLYVHPKYDSPSIEETQMQLVALKTVPLNVLEQAI